METVYRLYRKSKDPKDPNLRRREHKRMSIQPYTTCGIETCADTVSRVDKPAPTKQKCFVAAILVVCEFRFRFGFFVVVVPKVGHFRLRAWYAARGHCR